MDRLKKTFDSVMVMKKSGLQTASVNAYILSWFELTVSWGCHEGQWLLGTRHWEPQNSSSVKWMGSTLVARAAGTSRTSPSPGHRALPWEWAEDRLGHRLADQPDSVDAQLGKAGLWGAGKWPCCGTSGAGADGLGGLLWGPGLLAGFGSTWEGWPGSVRPVDASMSLSIIFSFIWLYLNLFLFFRLVIFVMNYITTKEVVYLYLSGLPVAKENFKVPQKLQLPIFQRTGSLWWQSAVGLLLYCPSLTVWPRLSKMMQDILPLTWTLQSKGEITDCSTWMERGM